MPFSPTSSDRLLSIYLALGQYPVLGSRIRARMRAELFGRGIVTPVDFEAEVRENAIASQKQEGLSDPLYEEPVEIWEMRMERVRDQLTDLTFSQRLPYEFFEGIVREVLGERGVSGREQLLTINPELAPLELVFEQAMTLENLPEEERSRLGARLKESKVVLIRTMISDNLRYINIAREWFTIADLAELRRRKIGGGRIGGKAAGMLLASRVLHDSAAPALKVCLETPESYFIGSDVMYTFMAINNLVHWNDQKYKPESEMRLEFPQIVADFEKGSFPPGVLEKLQTMLMRLGNKPLIVRSSSLLEDNFGTSFAGKYESIFCPNQGSFDENLRNLTRAISAVYASVLNPDALLYRRSRGLLDYDERMAILIQVVVGEKLGDYYLPQAAGVAFSRNLYRWAPQIRREDGFVRMVWGLGTRAVDRVGNDYPRLIALSHPLLRPTTNPTLIRRYSQQFVDLIDLKTNAFRTLPVHDVLDPDYPALRYLAQMDEDGYFVSMRSKFVEGDTRRLVLTFEELLRRTEFAALMRQMLALLERSYRAPVDLEFTVQITPAAAGGKPGLCIHLLQCRPQSHLQATEQAPLPVNLAAGELIFETHFMVPQGSIENVRFVAFVPPESYFSLTSNNARGEVARAFGRLNAALAGETYIAVGPGRWGSTNPDLGVPIGYGDIFNTRALVELAGLGAGMAPEPSLGTHFFQDLLESQIYPLAISLDDRQTVFNRDFFYETPNRLTEYIPASDDLCRSLRLIAVSDYRPGCRLRVIMDDEKSTAVAFVTAEESQPAG